MKMLGQAVARYLTEGELDVSTNLEFDGKDESWIKFAVHFIKTCFLFLVHFYRWIELAEYNKCLTWIPYTYYIFHFWVA